MSKRVADMTPEEHAKHREWAREWWRRNGRRCAEKNRANVKRWRKRHPEKARALDRRWREENPEKAREKVRRCIARKIVEDPALANELVILMRAAALLKAAKKRKQQREST